MPVEDMRFLGQRPRTLLLRIITVRRVSAFLIPVPQAQVPTGKHKEDHVTAVYTAGSITEEP